VFSRAARRRRPTRHVRLGLAPLQPGFVRGGADGGQAVFPHTHLWARTPRWLIRARLDGPAGIAAALLPARHRGRAM
jgi:hypothetical protein